MADLIFVDVLPDGATNGSYVSYRWSETSVGSGWREMNVRSVAHKNQEKWLQEIDRWHQGLCRLASVRDKIWWLHQGSRLIALHPPVFEPLFFLRATWEVMRQEGIESMYVLGAPSLVVKLAREVLPQEISVVDRSQTALPPKAFGHLFLRAWRLLASICAILPTGVLNVFSRNSRATPSKPDLVVFTFLLNLCDFAKKGDHFFARTLFKDAVPPKRKVTWLIQTSVPRRDREIFKKTYPDLTCLFLHDFLRPWDIVPLIRSLWAHRSLTKALWREAPALRFQDWSSLLIAREFLTRTKAYPVNEILANLVLRRIFRSITPARLIYPYEEKPIERALLNAAPRKTKTVGYAHSFASSGLRYLKWVRPEEGGSPKPDLIASPGPGIEEWLERWGQVDRKILVPLGSARDHAPALGGRGQAKRILILLSLPHEIHVLASMLEQKPDLFRGFDVEIRKYPFAWHEEQRAGLLRIQRVAPEIRETALHQSLAEQLSDCSLVIFCATSAGIEAMLSGKIVIYLNMNGVVGVDPLMDKAGAEKVLRADSVDDLEAILEKINIIGEQGRRQIQDAEFDFARSIYAPFNAEAILQ